MNALGEKGIREVLIEATTNPLAPRGQRKDICDYVYGFGQHRNYRLGTSLVTHLETLAK
jgi:hypothetical protein